MESNWNDGRKAHSEGHRESNYVEVSLQDR